MSLVPRGKLHSPVLKSGVLSKLSIFPGVPYSRAAFTIAGRDIDTEFDEPIRGVTSTGLAPIGIDIFGHERSESLERRTMNDEPSTSLTIEGIV